MLDSRYLHLHEALGLGPMWLLKSAHIVNNTTDQMPSESASESNRTSASIQADVAPHVPNTPPSDTLVHPTQTTPRNTLSPRDQLLRRFRTTENHTPTTTTQPSTQPTALTSAALESYRQRIASTLTPKPIILITLCPSPQDVLNRSLFSGQSGILLDNMLQAVGFNLSQAHTTAWIKDETLFDAAPTTQLLEHFLPLLEMELAATNPHTVIYLGDIFHNNQFNDIFQRLHSNRIVCRIPHPLKMLRHPTLKAEAWNAIKNLKKHTTIQ